MTKYYLSFVLLFLYLEASSQVSDVADISFKIEGKKSKAFHYAFAEGDEITFSFNETSGKKVTVSFGEYGKAPKYQEYGVSNINNKVFNIQYTRVYELLFLNEEGKEKVCKIIITRKAQEATANFNTQVQWKEVYDTIFDIKKDVVTTGYKTIYKQKFRKVLSSVDTNLSVVLDRVERVASATNMTTANTTYIQFDIPAPIYEPSVFAPMKESNVVSWAYSISAAGNVKQWYDLANTKAGQFLIKNSGLSGGYSALAVLAIKGISVFSNPPTGNNVKYRLMYGTPAGWSMQKNGNSITSTEQITQFQPGRYALELNNDNFSDGINVDVKIMTVTVTKNYRMDPYTVEDQEPVKEQKTIKIPKKVNVTRRPVMEGTE